MLANFVNHIKEYNIRKSENSLRIGFSLIIFLLIFPLSLSINYSQNDDWLYYQMVKNFSLGNFILDPTTAPTFYLQGFLGVFFAFFFGITHLPVLTLLVSVLSFYIFWKIVNKFYIYNFWDGFLLSLLLLLNPLHVYSVFGFMTDNYFLLFFLLSLYYFLDFEKSGKYEKLVTCIVTTSLAFLTRQVALVLPLAVTIYYLFKKDFKKSIIFGLNFIALLSFYLLLFPRTLEMQNKSLQLHHLLEFSYSYSLIYAILIAIVSFLLPLILVEISKYKPVVKKQNIFQVTIFSIGIYLILNTLFNPLKLAWGEFPYLGNTFEKRGFYSTNLLGLKYYFIGFSDLFYYWDLISKILIASLISLVIYFKKKLINFHSILLSLYFLLMVLTVTFYDRYLIVVIPSFILLFLYKSSKLSNISRLIICFFLVFLVILNYEFSMDNIKSNRLVWELSNQLAQEQKINKNQIESTLAWNRSNPRTDNDFIYIFSYDKPSTADSLKNKYKLYATVPVKFPFSLFINPNLYIFRKI